MFMEQLENQDLGMLASAGLEETSSSGTGTSGTTSIPARLGVVSPPEQATYRLWTGLMVKPPASRPTLICTVWDSDDSILSMSQWILTLTRQPATL